MGEVPVLEHRGKRLSQSGVILHYLPRTSANSPRNEDERREILRWMFWTTTSSPATSPRCATWCTWRKSASLKCTTSCAGA